MQEQTEDTNLFPLGRQAYVAALSGMPVNIGADELEEQSDLIDRQLLAEIDSMQAQGFSGYEALGVRP